MGLLSLLLVAFATALGADSSFAMAEVTPTGAEGGFSQEPVGGTEDTRGLETQYQGQGATAGEARQQGLEVEEIDQLVANFRPFRFPLEWFITNRMQQQSATSYEQSHYRSGATQLEAKVVDAASASVSGTFAKKNVAVTFTYDALEGAENIHEYDTIYVSEIAGYEDDGTTEEGGLLLFVVKADEANIKCQAINPPKSGLAVPADTKLTICGNACSESQMIVDPETYLPVKDTLFLQKKISNIVMTDEWIEQARKVKFITKDVVGNGIYNHKRKCARSHWLGRKYMTNVKVSDAKIGQEPVYFEKGILRQINMSYTHEGDAIQWNDLIALSQMQHTDNAANTNSVALCGKNAVQKLQINGLQSLEVIFAILILRRTVTVNKVIIERNQHRVKTQDAQLNAQTFCRGSLTTRRGTRDKHHTCAVCTISLVNLVSHSSNLLLVESLGNLNHLADVAIQHLFIERTNGGHPHNIHPAVILAEDIEHLGPMYIHIELRWVGTRRQSDIETVVVTAYVKQMDITRIGSKRTIEIAHDVVHTIYIAIQTRTRVKQCNLIVKTEALVDAIYLRCEQTATLYGVATIYNLLHTLTQCLNLLVGDRLIVAKLAVKTAS